jgi:GxxExxY protein
MEINELAEQVIGCAFKVSNNLGAGFLEKVYENALVYELTKKGIKVQQQYPVKVKYEDVIVGEYLADLLVEDCLLVELKAVGLLEKIHLAQCLNYLKATGLKICLLINFGKTKVQVRRLVNHF